MIKNLVIFISGQDRLASVKATKATFSNIQKLEKYLKSK